MSLFLPDSSRHSATPKFEVIGDLVRPQPLNFWSEIKLLVWDMAGRSDLDIYRALSAVSEEPEIRLLDAEKDYLTVEEKEAIEQEWVAI